MVRYIFVQQRELGWAVGCGTRVYRHLLESWNAESRDGDGRTSSFADYLRHFTALIDDVSLNGYDQARYREFHVSVDELIFNPAYHFSYKGVNLSFEAVLLFKAFCGTKKDLRDCHLIMEDRLREPIGNRVRRSVHAS